MLKLKNPKTPVKITLLPFYGGAKGQTLQITETADGSTTTNVIDTPIAAVTPEETSLFELENPPLPNRYETEYGQNIKNIHNSAINILKLQEKAKSTGLNTKDEEIYKGYVDSLSESAQKLSKIYDVDQDEDGLEERAGLSSWFARKKGSSNKKEEDKKKEEEKKKKEEEKKRKEEEKKKDDEKKKAEEKKKLEEENKRKAEEAKKEAEKKKEEEEESDDGDSVAIGLPSEEASIAEAKPVGLAVAGIGGVASSKPIATAVVGPGGLAIARPVGTAIAGVSPDQALVPIYAEGFVVPSKIKGKGEKKVHSTEYLNKIISKYHHV